ncbi:uncharacterized protein MONBRDRAFT_37498 [Monosiga brevicollis MX1]|uniref:Protein-serine/threonine kinase n=1 Tax=Monosiga brevicollis TaxID=81824 RepID=A9V237_MONBE|nr:uncharacterized protein MONBRDRAFT_37498 [Monosiga brevicollis MX1]EDQ88313.1 predicted protein [Monosiga brevicollis MX1]|eukprot:XP_001746906.1 hypothetical protein [Monosiga brevicollis MX1]
MAPTGWLLLVAPTSASSASRRNAELIIPVSVCCHSVAAARTLSAELPRCLLHASQQLVTWSPPSRLRLARTLEAYMPYLTWYRLVANTLANHGDPSAPVVPDALSLWPNQMQAVSVPALLGIIQQAADDAASLMLEKYGVGAPIHVEKKDGDASDCHHLLAVPEHLAYAYTEVCKNALGAMHRRYGSDCDLEAPVVATLAVRADPEPAIVVTIVDQGDGLSRTSVPDAMRWFATGSAPVEREPSYTFSGDFGGELSGKGTGMPLSRCYQTVAGGQLHLEPTTRQRGCKVTCVHPLLSGSK